MEKILMNISIFFWPHYLKIFPAKFTQKNINDENLKKSWKN